MSQTATWGTPRSGDGPTSASVAQQRTDDSLDALLSAHSGSSRPAYAVAGTVWYDTDVGLLFLFDGTNDLPMMTFVAVPTAQDDPGVPYQVALDSDYLYICTAADTWGRVALTNSW